MRFADIHNHSLFGVDDGPATAAEMYAMVDAAWADGVGAICLTPHFHPGYFGLRRVQAERAFQVLCRYASEKYPELRLYLGNELRWSPESPAWLESGDCRTLGGTDHVLVDFSAGEGESTIVKGLRRLLSAGYRPVLAHAERYRDLKTDTVRALSRSGALIQIDVQSLFGGYGLGARLRCGKLLKHDLVDIAATDAHDLGRRGPLMSRAYREIAKKYGEACACAIFAENPLALLAEPGKEQ